MLSKLIFGSDGDIPYGTPIGDLYEEVKYIHDSLDRAGIQNLDIDYRNDTYEGVIRFGKNVKFTGEHNLKFLKGKSALLILRPKKSSSLDLMYGSYACVFHQKPALDESQMWVNNTQPLTDLDQRGELYRMSLQQILDKLYDEIVPSMLDDLELDAWQWQLEQDYLEAERIKQEEIKKYLL